jgi:hypothetical protein
LHADLARSFTRKPPWGAFAVGARIQHRLAILVLWGMFCPGIREFAGGMCPGRGCPTSGGSAPATSPSINGAPSSQRDVMFDLLDAVSSGLASLDVGADGDALCQPQRPEPEGGYI